MKLLRIILLALITSLAACGDPGPALSVSNVQIVAPAPGRSASVAYMIVNNNTGDPVSITGISSPQFGRAEFHETVITEGIARMQPMSDVSVDADSQLVFEPGARHIMLLDPTGGLVPGKTVSVQLQFGAGELLLIDAPLSTRTHPDPD